MNIIKTIWKHIEEKPLWAVSNTYRSYVRLCLILVCLLGIAGCSSLKSSLITGAATSAVVGVTSVLPGGVIVPSGSRGSDGCDCLCFECGKPR